MYFYGGSVLVEVVDIEDFKLLHEGGCMCSGWYVAYQPNKFLLKCSEWLDVRLRLSAVPHTVMLPMRCG